MRTLMKRIFDVSVVLLAAGLALPLMCLVALTVLVNLGRPVFFRQRRPGLHAEPFTMYKFRTMSDARDESGELLPESKRLGRVGSVLRRYSLDELPELLNVLRGEMSLVGPRPLLMEYLPLYNSTQARRHEVKPGLTGWAQVRGRNSLSWEEKFDLDVWYVDNQSLLLDLRIIALTVWQILRPSGVNMEGYTTMPPFRGSE